ncbi:glycosyltransferase family 4 protein [Sphingomonas sp. KC8]|uniref:glycosyltransferase family 4 protein n=1 Tax=Sphingomonas sp. KC8 TaxID=1030157 RepID=UPI000248987D|nr:glycosyltransferase family 4 protein [Sphingomonas sp. KC8]ARS27229.1 glycosyl transferase [Sphingomonas sp. KC8]
MKIVVIASLAYSLINFRGRLIADMIAAGHDVLACAPGEDGAVIEQLWGMGARFRSIPMGRVNLNPIEDARTLMALVRLFRDERPDIILAYTQKPIIYAGFAHRILRRGRFFPMVTGLGYAFSEQGHPWLRHMVAALYSVAVGRASAIIAFNADDRDELRHRGIARAPREIVLVPGSGVDMAYFAAQPLPVGGPIFLLIARLLHDKGLREFVAAASIVRRSYPAARFQLLGPFDPNPAAISPAELEQWQKQGIVEYLGETRDVRPFLAACSVFVLPSYREGMPRTVLEAMAAGRAIVTTDAPGCRETVCEGLNGLLVPARDSSALAQAMARFCREPALAGVMGACSRRIAQQRFAVQTVNGMVMDIMGLKSGASAHRHAIGISLSGRQAVDGSGRRRSDSSPNSR